MTANSHIDKGLEYPGTKGKKYHIAKIIRKYFPNNCYILEFVI